VNTNPRINIGLEKGLAVTKRSMAIMMSAMPLKERPGLPNTRKRNRNGLKEGCLVIGGVRGGAIGGEAAVLAYNFWRASACCLLMVSSGAFRWLRLTETLTLDVEIDCG
jgi:hypothetical protein